MIENQLFIDDSFYINFYTINDPINKISDGFRIRHNVESLSIINDWLIDSHEALSCTHGLLKRDEDLNDKYYRSIINKLNILISHSKKDISLNQNNITNVRFNSVGIKTAGDTVIDYDEITCIELSINNGIAKTIILNVEKDNGNDDLKFLKNLGITSIEEELIDKMVFLIDRNNRFYHK